MLDILQSVPILGFLTITVTFFIAVFPHSIVGLELRVDLRDLHVAGVEHDVQLLPLADQPAGDLDEAARLMRLTKWERFWRLDVPSSMIGLVWNGMMSFGGGWFFLTASEAITVNEPRTRCPASGATSPRRALARSSATCCSRSA